MIDHSSLCFELPNLDYDRTGMLSMVSDLRYRPLTFAWTEHSDDSWSTQATTDHDLVTLCLGWLRQRWHGDGYQEADPELLMHPSVMSVITRLNPELDVTPHHFHINTFRPGVTWGKHIDRGRESVIMLPLDPVDPSAIEFYVDDHVVVHPYRCATLLNSKILHDSQPDDRLRVMAQIAIVNTPYARCAELAAAGELFSL
jgi:hypothetical protein